MKKSIFLAIAAVLFSGSVLMAQTPVAPQTPTSKQPPKHQAIKKDMRQDAKGYAKNSKQIRNDKQNLQTAKENGNKKAEVKDMAKLRVDKRQRHHDVKDMKHDVRKAEHGRR